MCLLKFCQVQLECRLSNCQARIARNLIDSPPKESTPAPAHEMDWNATLWYCPVCFDLKASGEQVSGEDSSPLPLSSQEQFLPQQNIPLWQKYHHARCHTTIDVQQGRAAIVRKVLCHLTEIGSLESWNVYLHQTTGKSAIPSSRIAIRRRNQKRLKMHVLEPTVHCAFTTQVLASHA